MKQETFSHKIKFLLGRMVPRLFVGSRKYMTIVNMIAATLHPLLSIFVIKYVLDMVNSPNFNLETLIISAFLYAGLYILFNIINLVLVTKARYFFTMDRLDLFNKLLKNITTMDHELFENSKEMTRHELAFQGVGGDNFGYQNILLRLFTLLPQIILAIIFSFILVEKSVWIVLILVISMIVNLYFATKYGNFENMNAEPVAAEARRYKAYRKVSVDSNYGKDIRVFGLSDRILDNINKVIEKWTFVVTKSYKYIFKLSFFENLSIRISDFVCYVVLSYLAINGQITMSEMVMLLSLVVVFSSSLNSIRTNCSEIYTQTGYVMHSYDMYESKLNFNEFGKEIKFEGPVSIKFENVSYKYPGSENFVYKNLSFEIEKGKKIALVGINGAGKTTIVKLMTGLARPTSGEIYINEINIKELSNKSIFDLYSAVFQETAPIASTIAENVSSNEFNIDYERVEKVLRQVGLWEKVSSFEKGYNTEMLKVLYEEGVIFSGGENQKLMIARALYKENTSVMIMDEPTAALDAIAEERIYQDFDNYMGDKTGIFISHRLASTKFCDEIMLLDGGEIVAKGTHEELLKTCEKYKDMFEMQGKYYKEEVNEKI